MNARVSSRFRPCVPGRSHWWVIAAPEGPTSVGRCRWCGAERDYRNGMDDLSAMERVYWRPSKRRLAEELRVVGMHEEETE